MSDWIDRGHHPGRFWLPASPERRVPGILAIEDGHQPSVYLWDTLEEWEPGPAVTIPVRQEFPLVLGAVGLGAVTLVGCRAHHSWFDAAGDFTGDLTARAVYLGQQYSADRLVYDRIRVEMDGLASLVPFTLCTHEQTEDQIYSWKVDTSQSVTASFGDIDVCLRLAAVQAGWKLGEAPPRREILSTGVFLEGTSASSLDLLDWIELLVRPLASLVGFALGRRLPLRHLDRLDPYPETNGGQPAGARSVPIVGFGIELNAAIETNLVHEPMVSFHDDGLLERWHELWTIERKRDAVQRILHAEDPGSSPKSAFTDLVEAAEGWHKAVHGCTYRGPGDKQTKWILAERLDDLLQPLRLQGMTNLPTGTELKDCRNELAHGDVLPDLSLLLSRSRALRVALRYHVAVDLGVSEDEAVKRARLSEMRM